MLVMLRLSDYRSHFRTTVLLLILLTAPPIRDARLSWLRARDDITAAHMPTAYLNIAQGCELVIDWDKRI